MSASDLDPAVPRAITDRMLGRIYSGYRKHGDAKQEDDADPAEMERLVRELEEEWGCGMPGPLGRIEGEGGR